MLFGPLLLFFLFGTSIGSFLNVVVLRYGTKKLSGRSKCFSCGKMLHWFELLPILSFLVQRGRCRGCKTGISFQYPLVELVTGMVFLGVAWKESFFILSSSSLLSTFYLLLTLLLWSLLIALSVYDLRHKIIPDALVFSACLISLLFFLHSYFILYTSSSIDFWSGLFFAAPFVLIWFLSRGRAMGLGDAKLVVLFPWFLGLAGGLSALVLGFWIGAGVALFGLLLKRVVALFPRGPLAGFGSRLKNLGMKTELPLGPFLVLGLFLVYVFGWDVTGLQILLNNAL